MGQDPTESDDAKMRADSASSGLRQRRDRKDDEQIVAGSKEAIRRSKELLERANPPILIGSIKRDDQR